MFPVKAFERIRKGKEDDSQRVKESNTDANRRSDFPIGPDQTAYRHGPIGKSDLQETDFDLFTCFQIRNLSSFLGRREIPVEIL